MSHLRDTHQPGEIPAGTLPQQSWAEWVDVHSRTFFIAPAVSLILIFAIFPTFYSIVFALSRVKFTANGLRFRFVWFDNFVNEFTGPEQVHFLGRIGTLSTLGCF
jgi:multiple sugar transport system permease protein